MLSYLKYLVKVLKHKWFVLVAGRTMVTVSWRRLIMHDLSKLLPSEFFAYRRQFFGPADKPDEFARAWLHHQNHNDHHWEYWIPRTNHFADSLGGAPDPLPMLPEAVDEMTADWLGDTRAYTGSWPDRSLGWPWLEKNWYKIVVNMNPDSIDRLRSNLVPLGYLLEQNSSDPIDISCEHKPGGRGACDYD